MKEDKEAVKQAVTIQFDTQKHQTGVKKIAGST